MTEQARVEMLPTTLWTSNRNLLNFSLASELDGTNMATPVRQSLDQYFGSIGGVPDLSTTDEARQWAEKLQAEHCFPESTPITGLQDGERLRINLARPVFLGLLGLTITHVKEINEDYASMLTIYQRVVSPMGGRDFYSQAIRRAVSGNILKEGLLLAEASFTSKAFASYFDRRSQEKGFVKDMIALKQSRRFSPAVPVIPKPPTDLRPWEVELD